MAAQTPTPEARQARDVMAFGQDVGRVLSDGRIVGRAEPFAKVFASSRVVKRAVGLAAWGVLEDIALDAVLDERGRLVAETNVRRIAANLGLNKDTVTRHLRRLREYGFVFQEELRAAGSGRYEVCRYVLDPSACFERFTHTPPVASSTPAAEPCPKNPDTAPDEPVSEEPGHRATGHGVTGHGESGQPCRDVDFPPQEQQQAGGEREPEVCARLRALGVAGHVAEDLIARHPADRVRDVVDAADEQQLRKPAGWIVSALRDGWDLTDLLARRRDDEERERRQAAVEAAEAEAARSAAEERERADGFPAVSSALDEAQLARAVTAVTTPAPGLGRGSVPLARAQLLSWAVTVHGRSPDRPLAEALAADLAGDPQPVVDDGAAIELPPPPPTPAVAGELSARIAACLPHLPAPTPSPR